MQTNRRNFLKSSAAISAGLGVMPASMLYSRSVIGSNDKLVVSLIGCRNMGWSDLQDILLQPNVVCKTLCDVDDSVLEATQKKVVEMGFKAPGIEKDYRKVIDDKDIDAVIIGTPDHWHCLPCVEACESGKHVYVEKPLANSIGEINVMKDAARKYGSLVQVGQQQRSGKHWNDVMDFIWSGKLGTIRQVSYWANFNYGSGNFPVPDEEAPEGVDYDRWLGPAPSRPYNRNRYHGSWRMFRDYGGGLMSDWGVHLLDMGLWAMKVEGPPQSVRSIGGNFANKDRANEMPDTLNALYEMDGFNMVWEHNGGIQSGQYDQPYGIKFIGTHASLVVDRAKWRVFPEWRDGEFTMEEFPPQKAEGNSHLNHCANFVSAIRNGDPLAADIEVAHLAALYAHMGNIAYWSDEVLHYDSSKRHFKGARRANELITPEYRDPWKFPKV